MIKMSERVNTAQHTFGTSGTLNNSQGRNHFNIPKAKYNFIVHFELTTKAIQLIQEIHGSNINLGSLTAFVIKDIDKPSFTMQNETINQYNRTRVMPGKLLYDPVSLVMYDTVNSAALLLIDAYRTFYYGDFSDKSLQSWDYDMISKPSSFEDESKLTYNDYLADYTWGRSVFNMGDRDDGYFFKRIDIYEIDGSIYTVHNIHHPIIESVKFDNKTHESEGEPSLISLSLSHEGISNICPSTNTKAIGKSTLELGEIIFGQGEFSSINFYKSFGELDKSLSSNEDPNISKRYSAGTDLDFGISDVFSLGDTLTGGLLSSTSANIQGAISTGTNAIKESGRNAIKSIGGLF